jgi:hypothetical protein
MDKMILLLAFAIAGTGCAKKKEPESAPTAKQDVSEGVLMVSLKGITVERLVSQPDSQTDDLVGWLKLENTGGTDLSVTKIEYSVVKAGETTDAKTWEHSAVNVAPGATEVLELHDKVIWNGTGDFPHKEVQFQGTAYYTTSGEQKTAAFKLPGAVEKKE